MIKEKGEKIKKTFERTSEFEDVFGDGDDFRADAIAGEESYFEAFVWCGGGGGGATDPAGFGGVLDDGFEIERSFDRADI